MRQAFYALCYLHNNKICHRDIKPENFLLFKENDDSYVKLIDFGLAKRVTKDEVMTAPNGTPYYIAPEVLKGSYTTQCDNWSMGVVLFIMLSGKPPFGGKSNKEIIDNVLKGEYSFKNPVWEHISAEAKDLLAKLLDRQADMRITAEEAYNHPWIQQQKNKEFKDVEISGDVFSNMENFTNSVALKRTTLSFIASRIPEDQIQSLRLGFSKMDKNGDGQLTLDELREGLKEVPEIALKPEDLEKAISVMDSNQNGLIDYTEFIAACLQSYNYLKENHLRSAFSYFDKDNSGTIS
jgi:calcium-dependent protein kinase